jgi:hypothetical protein
MLDHERRGDPTLAMSESEGWTYLPMLLSAAASM